MNNKEIQNVIDVILTEYNRMHDRAGKFGSSATGDIAGIDSAINTEIDKILPKPTHGIQSLSKVEQNKQREVWRIRKQLQRALNLQNKRCSVCGSNETLERHHIDGSIRNNSLKNIAVMCEKDHVEIHKVMGVGRYENLKKAKSHNVRESIII